GHLLSGRRQSAPSISLRRVRCIRPNPHLPGQTGLLSAPPAPLPSAAPSTPLPPSIGLRQRRTSSLPDTATAPAAIALPRMDGRRASCGSLGRGCIQLRVMLILAAIRWRTDTPAGSSVPMWHHTPLLGHSTLAYT